LEFSHRDQQLPTNQSPKRDLKANRHQESEPQTTQ